MTVNDYKYNNRIQKKYFLDGVSKKNEDIINNTLSLFLPTIEKIKISKDLLIKICYNGYYKYAYFEKYFIYDYENQMLYLNKTYFYSNNKLKLKKAFDEIFGNNSAEEITKIFCDGKDGIFLIKTKNFYLKIHTYEAL